MQSNRIYLNLIGVVLMTISVIFTTQAHLMLAQQGTLNIIDSDAFVVVSLPVSAFDGIDGCLCSLR